MIIIVKLSFNVLIPTRRVLTRPVALSDIPVYVLEHFPSCMMITRFLHITEMFEGTVISTVSVVHVPILIWDLFIRKLSVCEVPLPHLAKVEHLVDLHTL